MDLPKSKYSKDAIKLIYNINRECIEKKKANGDYPVLTHPELIDLLNYEILVCHTLMESEYENIKNYAISLHEFISNVAHVINDPPKYFKTREEARLYLRQIGLNIDMDGMLELYSLKED